MNKYERPTTAEKVSISIPLGMLALLSFSIANFAPTRLGTIFYGTISSLILFGAAYFVWPENYWPKSIIFQDNIDKDAEDSNSE